MWLKTTANLPNPDLTDSKYSGVLLVDRSMGSMRQALEITSKDVRLALGSGLALLLLGWLWLRVIPGPKLNFLMCKVLLLGRPLGYLIFP